MFTKACHFSLSWSKLFQSTTTQHLDLILISILFSYLLLVILGYLFPLEFPTKPLHGFLFSLIPITCIRLFCPLGQPSHVCWRVQAWSSSLSNLLRSPVTSSLLGPNASLGTLISKIFILSLSSSLCVRDQFFHSIRPVQVADQAGQSLTFFFFFFRFADRAS